MIELGVIRDLVAIFGVIAGLTYYVMTVRNTQRNQQMQLDTRQAQLFMQIYSLFNDQKWMQNYLDVIYRWDFTDFEDWLGKYGPEADSESASKYGSLMAYFEGVGVLVDQGLIDTEAVSRLLSTNLIYLWEKMGPLIKERRKLMNNPFTWEYVEWLYNRVKKERPSRQPRYLSI
ncbi:MAG: DUF4760 domain-containing protein [Promethearchaeota archaeon]|jgi:hypothetical protein